MGALPYIQAARAAQLIFALTVLGLTAYVSAWWSSHWRQSSPSEVNFLIFAPCWSLLSLVPLVLIPLKFAHLQSSALGQFGMLGVEGLAMMFWFAGWVALAVFLSDRICFGQVCDVARAATALGAVNWALWAATFGVGAAGLVKSGMGRHTAGKGVEMKGRA